MNKLSKLALGSICTASIVACFDSGTQTSTAKPTVSQAQITAFQDSCNKAGGEFYKTPGCNGTAKCKGSYINLDSAKFTYNECAGKNACNGYQCIEPNAMKSSMAMSSSATSSVAMSSTAMSSTAISSMAMSSMAMSSMAMSSMAMSSSSVSATAKATLLASPTALAFTQNCTAAGGTPADQLCNGHNTCAGIYFHNGSYGTPVGAKESACSGHNTCAGIKCEI